jgi:hypothetical protein
MQNRLLLITFSAIAVMVFGLSCHPNTPEDNTTEYTSLGWRTTVEDASERIGIDVPAPAYIPEGYEIKEVYIKERNHATVDKIVILISDEEIIWQGDEYQCKIRISIEYGSLIGLKIEEGKSIKIGEVREWEVWGYLLGEEGDHYQLWYQWNPGSRGQAEIFEMAITAYTVISEEELLKIAESTLY